MGKFDGKLLFSDLDGTLFDSSTRIPVRNLEGIRYFTENGGMFSVATGRSALSLCALRSQLAINCPCVVLNGCAVYDYEAGKPLYTVKLCDQAVAQTVRLSGLFEKTINTVVFFKDGSMSASMGTASLPPCFDAKNVPSDTLLPENVIDHDWLKVVFVGEAAMLKALAAEANAADLGNTNTVFAGEDMFELLPGGITKGDGMLRLSEHLGIPVSDVFAVGDYYNDREMLLSAGISAVAGQAPDDLKMVADYTACHCDDGTVGWFVEKLDTLF